MLDDKRKDLLQVLYVTVLPVVLVPLFLQKRAMIASIVSGNCQANAGPGGVFPRRLAHDLQGRT
jgi:hypothetical protein